MENENWEASEDVNSSENIATIGKLLEKTTDEPIIEKPLVLSKRRKSQKKGIERKELVVVEDKTQINARNSFKHGKYANIPIECNNCYYRAEDVGGNGKCNAYVKDSLCTVRDDIKQYCAQMDSRKPDDLKTLVDNSIKLLNERVMFSAFTAGMDGNLLDKATNAQLNSLHQFIKLAYELQGNIKVTATEMGEGDGDADFITKMFRQVKIEKTGGN